ncbi:MAG: MBL fold metallo-hydrolase [Syntrophomonadaceae bacterium]|nr:MBL fold metallo-hydrolase [Syntrophomonadaceae bacterium]
MLYKIYPIYNGSFLVRFGEKSPFKDINIPSFVFLLIGEDNEKILVDTGFAPDYIPGINSTYSRQPQEELAHALLELNTYPDEIKTIIFTHLHWDHTGGINLFPKAQFYVQSRELLSLIDINPNEECSFNTSRWINYLDNFVLLDGHHEFRPGINLLSSGKHTQGHQVVEVKTKSGQVILGGDLPFVYDKLWEWLSGENWDDFRSTADPKFFWSKNIREILQTKLVNEQKNSPINSPVMTLASIKSRADIFITSHDPKLRKIDCI